LSQAPVEILGKPLELLASHRVIFHDTMDTHLPTIKLQMVKRDPVDLQLVVDFVAKEKIAGRDRTAPKSVPKAYLHLRIEDMPGQDNLILTALACALILQNRGKKRERSELRKQLTEDLLTGRFLESVVESTYLALEAIEGDQRGSAE
jgi:hypothetical protein